MEGHLSLGGDRAAPGQPVRIKFDGFEVGIGTVDASGNEVTFTLNDTPVADEVKRMLQGDLDHLSIKPRP